MYFKYFIQSIMKTNWNRHQSVAESTAG